MWSVSNNGKRPQGVHPIDLFYTEPDEVPAATDHNTQEPAV